MEKIKICGDIKHPPFEFINQEGEMDGFCIEITKSIAEEMNFDIEIELLEWTEAIRSIESGRHDAIQSMSISGNRPERYIFGAEYLTVFHSAFALKKRKDIRNIINIDKYRVAVQENDVGFDIISRMGCSKNPVSILVVSSQEDVLKLLLSEKVDLAVGNKLTLLYYADQLGIQNDIKLIGNPLNLTKYGVAFKKNNAEVAKKFNLGMRKIKNNGKYEEIYDKWFGYKMGYFGKQIIENVETGVIYIDRLGRITAINNFAENILNLSSKKMLFKSFYETEIASIFNTHIIQKMLDERQDAYYGEIEIEKNSIKIYLEVNYARLLDDEHNSMGVLINFKDITDKKKMEKTLMRKDKMESLGFLLINVAHELRNPITSIKNFIELIPEHLDDEEFRESLLYYVPKQIEYIDSLFSNLLEYSKPKEAKITTIYVKELVESEFMKSFYKMIKQDKDINIEIDVPENFTIRADYNQIKQVIINLVLNASDSINNNGTIKICAREERNKKIIIIEDDGKSIPATDISKIFDPFFTTKEDGYGLGLYISYNLMKENKGVIEIENTDDGARVLMMFDK